MPNWCSNSVTFKHTDEKAIDRIVAAESSDDGLFGSFFPCPEELCIDAQLGTDDPELIALYKANEQNHGAAHWYDWCRFNWGTKWDASSVGMRRVDATTVSLSFDTAWSPPIEWYEKMATLGYTIDAKCIETGVAFYGSWSNEDGYQEGQFSNLDDIPQAIVDEFPWIEDMFADEEDYKDIDAKETTE